MRPAFPAPSDIRGREIQIKLARKPRRDREAVSVYAAGCLKCEAVRPSFARIASDANRHCEPTGRRKAPPDDKLREAIHGQSDGDNGLLRRGVYHRARRRRDPLAPRNDGLRSDTARNYGIKTRQDPASRPVGAESESGGGTAMFTRMVRWACLRVSNHEAEHAAILRDASRSLSSGAHSRDPLASSSG